MHGATTWGIFNARRYMLMGLKALGYKIMGLSMHGLLAWGTFNECDYKLKGLLMHGDTLVLSTYGVTSL